MQFAYIYTLSSIGACQKHAHESRSSFGRYIVLEMSVASRGTRVDHCGAVCPKLEWLDLLRFFYMYNIYSKVFLWFNQMIYTQSRYLIIYMTLLLIIVIRITISMTLSVIVINVCNIDITALFCVVCIWF